MSDYVILRSTENYRFNLTAVSRAVETVSKATGFGGVCIYFPSPDGDPERFLLAVDGKDADKEDVDWFLAHVAGHLEAELLAADGSPYLDTDETDIFFLESIPAPEEEHFGIKLYFSYNTESCGDGICDRLDEVIANSGYEVTVEPDGYTFYLAANSYLDLFVTEGNRITGEIDCTFSGAGVYVEAVRVAKLISEGIGCEVTFIENPDVTYTVDGDFGKLRRMFYIPAKQQLSFAYNDDRDCFQGYFGWGTDAFEMDYRQGTLVTPLGRYDFDELKHEIEKYGFSYVCDFRLLPHNRLCKSAENEYKDILNVMWNMPVGARHVDNLPEDKMLLEQCQKILEETYLNDPYSAFPLDVYRYVVESLGVKPMKFEHMHEMPLHFKHGYMNEEVYFGFGHYLRRFKLPGYLIREERVHGHDVTFVGYGHKDLIVECSVTYNYHGDGSESVLGDNYVTGDEEDIEVLDLGGSSYARYIEQSTPIGSWHAEAEVFICDEIYRFAATSADYDSIRRFYDALKGSISVEEFYDDTIKMQMPDPHASGATFCHNGVVEEEGEYSRLFPVFIRMYDIPDFMEANGEQGKAAVEKMFEFFNELIGRAVDENGNLKPMSDADPEGYDGADDGEIDTENR